MKIMMMIGAVMMAAGIALSDVVLGLCGLVTLVSGATDLIARRRYRT